MEPQSDAARPCPGHIGKCLSQGRPWFTLLPGHLGACCVPRRVAQCSGWRGQDGWASRCLSANSDYLCGSVLSAPRNRITLLP